jgi:cobyric acid synthase
MHGIFDNDGFRSAYLKWLRNCCFGNAEPLPGAAGSYRQRKEDGFNALAKLLQNSLDMAMIDRVSGVGR